MGRHKRPKSQIERSEFVIAQDTREQLPWTFAGLRSKSGKLIIPRVQRTTLDTGDYSVVGLFDTLRIERKSLEDLYGVCGRDRARFVRELERLQEFRFAYLIIESDWGSIEFNPPMHSKLSPKSVIHSLISWSVAYGVHVLAMPSRNAAEAAAYNVMRFAWQTMSLVREIGPPKQEKERGNDDHAE